MKNSIVKWNNSYSVGIKPIDDQHKELIRLTNKLFASCMEGNERTKSEEGSANRVFLEVIHEAVDYVGYHFGIEERIMERIDYPEYMIHKQEHVSFAQEIVKKTREFKNGRSNTPLSFVHYLKDWVLEHIAVSDKKLGNYLQEMHKSGAFKKTPKTKVNNNADNT